VSDIATGTTEQAALASQAIDHFGEQAAAHYDERLAEMFDPAVVEPAADFLAELAGEGAALELGIGTGRIALPLAARGVRVHGVDLSEAMVARLREKPGGERIPVTIGDFATTRVEGSFALVYLIFNTIPNLCSQQEQVACFRNAAAHLEPDGRFVIEVRVPQLRLLPPGQNVRAFQLSDSYVGIDEYDVANQRLISHHYRLSGGAVELRSIPFRYVWPAELDLMAELAGMQLQERWASWKREPFTAESDSHISVWKPSRKRDVQVVGAQPRRATACLGQQDGPVDEATPRDHPRPGRGQPPISWLESSRGRMGYYGRPRGLRRPEAAARLRRRLRRLLTAVAAQVGVLCSAPLLLDGPSGQPARAEDDHFRLARRYSLDAKTKGEGR
jgi:SAM-dependent methyltransferase